MSSPTDIAGPLSASVAVTMATVPWVSTLDAVIRMAAGLFAIIASVVTVAHYSRLRRKEVAADLAAARAKGRIEGHAKATEECTNVTTKD